MLIIRNNHSTNRLKGKLSNISKQFGDIRDDSGFTIVEIMVVIVIVGVLASIAFSGLRTWIPNYRLKAAAEELHSSMQRAKAMAVKANRSVGMEFFPVVCPPEGGSYRFFIDDGAGTGTAKDDTMTGSESAFLSVSMPAGVCLSGTSWGGNRGGFTAQGVTSASGPGSVTLRHVKIARTYTVSVLVSGGVKIQ